MGPTSEVEIVKTRFPRKLTLLLKPLMIIKAWICLRVLRLGSVGLKPILFLIILLPNFDSH